MSNSSTPWPPASVSTDISSESRAGSLIACVVVTLLLSGAAVGARFYTRGRIQHVLAREDWTILVAWVEHPVHPLAPARSNSTQVKRC